MIEIGHFALPHLQLADLLRPDELTKPLDLSFEPLANLSEMRDPPSDKLRKFNAEDHLNDLRLIEFGQ
jgi:hypothetical protein